MFKVVVPGTSDDTYTTTTPGTAPSTTTPTDGGTTTAPLPQPPAPNGTTGLVRLSGALADGTAFDVSVNPGERSSLTGTLAGGSVVCHADGKSVCIENCYMGLTSDLTGTFHLTAGDTVLFDGPLTVWAYARTRPFWISDPPPLASPRLDVLPHIPLGGSASMYDSYMASDRSPMGPGPVCTAMDTTGERPDLGQITAWGACAVANPTADNLAAVRGIADGAAVWACHVIDPATNDLVDIRTNPWISLLKSQRGVTNHGRLNPIAPFTSATPLIMGTGSSHMPQYVSPACAFFGTAYDAEELSFWANFSGGLWGNPAYRLPTGVMGPANDQVRSKGRMLAMLVYAAQMSDKPEWFTGWLHDLAAAYLTYFTANTGVHVDQHIDAVSGYKNSGFAPWQEQIVCTAFGQAIEAGFTDFQPLLDWYAPTFTAALLDAQHEFATSYTVSWRYPDGTIAQDWPDALKATAAYGGPMATAITCAEGSQALLTALGLTTGYVPGDFYGYPWAADGYPAQMQGTLAALVDHATDKARAQDAWTKFKQYARCDYSTNPKYNIVPRAA
jgi:hypothetical protein